MKSDIFNGKILEPYRGIVKFTLVFVPCVLIMCSLILGIIAITYPKIDDAARVMIFIFTALSGVSAIVYPLVTLRLIRCYPKHRKITKLFIQEYVFK